MRKKKKEAAVAVVEKQPNLYGEEDKVFNVLETDVTTIKAEIKAKYAKIEKLRSEIQGCARWLTEVEEARDIVGKTRKTAEPTKEKSSKEVFGPRLGGKEKPAPEKKKTRKTADSEKK